MYRTLRPLGPLISHRAERSHPECTCPDTHPATEDEDDDEELTDEGAVSFETSNPGRAGTDTGYSFRSPRGYVVRVLMKKGESRSQAISRVRARHGL
jgi:hypothetical protein